MRQVLLQFTQRRFDTYTPIHTEAFRHRLLFRESQKLWHREAFTHRIVYTQKLLHTRAFPQRSFWAQQLLHTDAFTHRSLYTRRLLRTEAFTQTEKPLHTDAFPQKKRFHRAAFTHLKKSQFYVSFWRSAIISCERVASGVGKSQFLYFWRWTIILRERVAPDLAKSQFYTHFISRETVVPSCAWRFKMDKVAILPPILERLHLMLKNLFSQSYCRLTFMHLNFQNHNFTPVLTVDPHFVRRGCAASHQICICHVFGCPTCAISAVGCPCPKEIHIPPHAWAFETHDLRRRLLRATKFRISPHHMFAHPARTISAEGCPRTNKTRISPHDWVSDTPQRVMFRKPLPGCPCRQREIEELEKSDFAGVQIQFDHLKVSWNPV